MSLAELVEAEGRSLRDNAFRLGVALALIALAACAALAAFVLLALGLYLGLQPHLGSAWAAVVTALLPLFLGGILLWCAILVRR